jgi:hypothetical protein
MKWQPIETAPKDGTQVVLWVAITGTGAGYSISRAFYRKNHWRYWEDESHALEECERPTHWFKISPPEEESKP